MSAAHDERSRAITVSTSPDLLAEAKRLDINLSHALEERLKELIALHRRTAWRTENEAAIAASAQFVQRHGVFGEDDREW